MVSAHSGTCDQILLLSKGCCLVSVWRPLWREDGSAVCSTITQWSEPHRTRSHTLLSHLRLSQPEGPGSRIYIPQGQDGPVIPPGTGFPLRHLLQLAGLRWRFLTLPQPGGSGSRIYIPLGQGGPVIPPGTGFPLRHLLQLAGLRWRFLTLPQPGGPGSGIYIPQGQGGPVITPGTGFPLRHLLQLAGLRWRYSNPPLQHL
jgi:hypothetical protein